MKNIKMFIGSDVYDVVRIGVARTLTAGGAVLTSMHVIYHTTYSLTSTRAWSCLGESRVTLK